MINPEAVAAVSTSLRAYSHQQDADFDSYSQVSLSDLMRNPALAEIIDIYDCGRDAGDQAQNQSSSECSSMIGIAKYFQRPPKLTGRERLKRALSGKWGKVTNFFIKQREILREKQIRRRAQLGGNAQNEILVYNDLQDRTNPYSVHRDTV